MIERALGKREHESSSSSQPEKRTRFLQAASQLKWDGLLYQEDLPQPRAEINAFDTIPPSQNGLSNDVDIWMNPDHAEIRPDTPTSIEENGMRLDTETTEVCFGAVKQR